MKLPTRGCSGKIILDKPRASPVDCFSPDKAPAAPRCNQIPLARPGHHPMCGVFFTDCNQQLRKGSAMQSLFEDAGGTCRKCGDCSIVDVLPNWRKHLPHYAALPKVCEAYPAALPWYVQFRQRRRQPFLPHFRSPSSHRWQEFRGPLHREHHTLYRLP